MKLHPEWFAACLALHALACSSSTDVPTGSDGSASGGASEGTSGGATGNTGGAIGNTGASTTGGATTGGSTSDGGTGAATSGGSGGTSPVELVPVTVFIAGDSTVATYADTPSAGDQAGWGQMFAAHFGSLVTIENRAVGGRTARRFIDEGRLDELFADVSVGDYLFVQFGTNDGNKSATYTIGDQTFPYYLDPNTDFKTYLMRYVDGARSREVTPVFVTPPPRNSAYCTGGNGTGAHAQAMRDLGAAEEVTVLDLNARSVDHLKAICPAPTPEDFFFLRANGTVDGTHFQENGARFLASFVALELAGTPLTLREYLE